MSTIQDILCFMGRHDWEEIKTVQEVTMKKAKIRICRNCNKSQRCEEKREIYTEWSD